MTVHHFITIDRDDDIKVSLTGDGIQIEFEEGETNYVLNLNRNACTTLLDYVFDVCWPSDDVLVKTIEARLKRRNEEAGA